MRVLVTALSAATGPDGVGRHVANLTRCLLQRPEIERVDLVAGKWQSALLLAMIGPAGPRLHLHEAQADASMLGRNLWYINRLPQLARALKSDLIHATYPVPISRSRLYSSVVVSLHDLYPFDAPENFGYPRVFLNRLILARCLSAADAIACVSRTTLTRLAQYNPSLMTKASCVYNCVEPVEGSASAARSELGGQPFILAVAQHRRNKNLILTLQVFERLLALDPKLLLCIAGCAGPETSAIYHQISRRSLEPHVVMLHGISDQQLQWCYHHARLLLATSSTEGFGLPIAEAMLTGCPIACTDIAAHRELGEGYAHFAPLDAAALGNAAARALQLPSPQAVALPHLSVSTLAEKYLHLYHKLLTSDSASLLSLQGGIHLKGDSA